MPSKESGLYCEAGGGLMRVLEEREAICQVGAAERPRDDGAKEGGGKGAGGHSGDQPPCSLL